MVTAKKQPVARKPAPVAPAKPPVRPALPAAGSVAPGLATAKSARKALAKPAEARKKPASARPVASPAPGAAKQAKPKKPKLVRDSFTIPKPEFAVLDDLKQRAARMGSPAKKSELLRAGIKALAAMADDTLLAALKAVPAIKTGRPTKS